MHRVALREKILDLVITVVVGESQLKQHTCLLRVIESASNHEALISTWHEPVCAPMTGHYRHARDVEEFLGSRTAFRRYAACTYASDYNTSCAGSMRSIEQGWVHVLVGVQNVDLSKRSCVGEVEVS